MFKKNWMRWAIALGVSVFLGWAVGTPFFTFIVGLALGLFQGPRIRDLLRIP